MKKKFRCPFCKRVLVHGEQKKYETLMEHVCDPNMEDYPERDTWVCDCEESQGCFWDDWGDLYSREYKRRTIRTEAINSGSRKSRKFFDMEQKLNKSWSGKIIIKIIYWFKLQNAKRWDKKLSKQFV